MLNPWWLACVMLSGLIGTTFALERLAFAQERFAESGDARTHEQLDGAL